MILVFSLTCTSEWFERVRVTETQQYYTLIRSTHCHRTTVEEFSAVYNCVTKCVYSAVYNRVTKCIYSAVYNRVTQSVLTIEHQHIQVTCTVWRERSSSVTVSSEASLSWPYCLSKPCTFSPMKSLIMVG